MFTAKPIERTIDDQTIRFYPMSLGMAGKLRVIAGPLVRSLTVLFRKVPEDQATSSKAVRDEHGLVESSHSTLAVTPELARERHAQRQQAVDDLVKALTSEESIKAAAEIILDSMRDQQDKPQGPNAVKTFIDQTPLPLFTPLLMGVAEANKELFGPLADLVPLKLRELKLSVMGTEQKPTAGEEPKSDPVSAQVATQ